MRERSGVPRPHYSHTAPHLGHPRRCTPRSPLYTRNPTRHAPGAQVSDGNRGDVTLLPTVVINQRQYRGKLERSSILSTICAGFKIGQAPEICTDQGFINNKCAKVNPKP